MKHLKLILCSLFLLMTSIYSLSANGNIKDIDKLVFSSESFEKSKAKAMNEGKLFFVDFYASWCMPCKWMDKTTFQDEEVQNLLVENFVPVKIDIDTEEGFDLKNQYGIHMLPTILIFDQSGQLVERIEETLTATKMVNLLSYHEQKKITTSRKPTLNTGPSEKEIKSNEEKRELENLYEQYQALEQAKTSYKVQVASYTSYEEAYLKVNELRDQFFEEIVVNTIYREGQMNYKVLMGNFKTMEEAESFLKILKVRYSMSGIIF